MMKNEKKSESEIEWEKEYNLRKAKRKWLLNKKKSELLALIQDSNALSKIKVMFCVVGFVVLILFVVVVFVFLFNIFLNVFSAKVMVGSFQKPFQMRNRQAQTGHCSVQLLLAHLTHVDGVA